MKAERLKIKETKTIWGKYMKTIVPAITAIILVIDITVYRIDSQSTRNIIYNMAMQTVKIEAENVSNIINGYVENLQLLAKNEATQRLDIESALITFKNYISDNKEDYTKICLTLPDGTSFNTLNETYEIAEVKKQKFFKEIFSENKNQSLVEPHKSQTAEGLFYTIAVPVKDKKGNVIAALSATFDNEKINKYITSMTINGFGFGTLINEKTIVMAYPIKENVMNFNFYESTKIGYIGLDDFGRQIISNVGGSGYGTCTAPNGYEMEMYYSYIKNSSWVLGIIVPRIQLYSNIYKLVIVLIVTGLFTILSLIFMIKGITRRIVIKPLKIINDFAGDFSQGRLYSDQTEKINAKDEIGTLNGSVKQMQSKLIGVVKDIRDSSKGIEKGSKIMGDTAYKVSEGAHEQVAAVEEISASIEEMTSSIEQNNMSAKSAKDNSDSIANDILSVSKASSRTLECIKNVINKVKIVNEIASRTDLLAINAAVEAARAGDNGKGFAVVASEIRKLAEHCQQASTQIDDSGAQSLKITERSVELIDKITPGIKKNAEMVSEIAVSCNEQLNGAMSINKAVQQLVYIAESNSKSSEQMTAYLSDLNKLRIKLNETVNFFKLDSSESVTEKEILGLIEQHNLEILQLKTKLALEAEHSEDILEKPKETVTKLQSQRQSIINNAPEMNVKKDPGIHHGVKIDLDKTGDIDGDYESF